MSAARHDSTTCVPATNLQPQAQIDAAILKARSPFVLGPRARTVYLADSTLRRKPGDRPTHTIR